MEKVQQSLEREYYKGDTLIPDDEFDVLDDQLVVHLDDAKKEDHMVSMGSMPKHRDEADINRFRKIHGNSRCQLELKLDGAGIELVYEYLHGPIVSCYILKQAISRGVDAGVTGRNVLPMVRMIRPAIPETIHVGDSRFGNKLSIRCEYVISNATFEASKYTYEWKHPRSAATGLLLRNELSIAHTLPQLLYYDVTNDVKQVVNLPINKFKISRIPEIGKYNVKELTAMFLQQLLSDYKRSYVYPIDGIVIHTDNPDIGLHGRYAFKPKRSDIAFSEVLSVDWQISKSGRLNPVANISPTLMDGAVVSKVTLNNLDYINDLKLCIGSVVEIQRAGEIIPEIVKNVTTENIKVEEIKVPSACPYCGGPVYKEHAYYYCGNTGCSERVIKAFEYTFKNVFKLKGFGYAYCKALLEKFRYIHKPLDLFKVDLEDLLSFAVNDSTNGSLSKVLFKFFKDLSVRKIALRDCFRLLCLRHTGSVWADKLASLCPTAHDYIRLLKSIYEGKLLDEYLDVPNNVLHSFILNKDLILEMFDLLGKYIRLPRIGVLKGKHFCLTGTAPRPRNDIIELIEFNGGTYSNSVSKKTNALFIGDNPGNTKLTKALQYGVPSVRITEQTIVDLVNENFTLKVDD